MLRLAAVSYLHFLARHVAPWFGLYQTAIAAGFVSLCFVLALVRRARWAYGFVLFAGVCFARIPWLAAGELNVDESMLLASAHRLLVFDPVFYRSVDGATSGPLNYYALLLPGLLGLKLDYALAHLVNACCLGGALVLLYLIARLHLPAVYAELAVLPMLAAVMVFREGDLVHYSSECVSLLLIAAAVYLLLSPLNPWKLFAIGVIAAALPFAKLQSLPSGLFLIASAFVFGGFRLGKFCLAGGAAVLFGAFGLLEAFGQLGEFFQSYLAYNLEYANLSAAKAWTVRSFFSFAIDTPETGILLVTALCYSAFIVVRRSRVFLFSLALLLVSIYTVYRPTRAFPHYWLYVVFPCCLVLVLSLKARPWELAGLLAVAVVMPLYLSIGRSGGDMVRLSREPAVVECRVCESIARYAHPGDPISIWGWAPGLYVQTGTIPATREAHTERQQEYAYPQRSRYEQRYLDELAARTPVLFVDAVGPGHFAMFDRKQHGHEVYPQVREFVESRFELVEEVDGYRLYARIGSERLCPTVRGPLPANH